MTCNTKKCFYYSSFFLALFVFYLYICYNPIIIHNNYPENIFPPDTVFNPIKNIDFTNGKNKIIIYTNKEDIRFLPHSIKKFSLIECTDNQVLENFKNVFYFSKKSNMISETTNFDSRIFIFKDEKLVFSSEFIIEESISLHFSNTGWVVAMDYIGLIQCIETFRPCYFPIRRIVFYDSVGIID